MPFTPQNARNLFAGTVSITNVNAGTRLGDFVVADNGTYYSIWLGEVGGTRSFDGLYRGSELRRRLNRGSRIIDRAAGSGEVCVWTNSDGHLIAQQSTGAAINMRALVDQFDFGLSTT